METVTGTLNKVQYDGLKQCWAKKENFTFIGPDGKEHEMTQDDDFIWHSNITTEEYLMYNNKKELETCKKCSMWEHCRKTEYTKFTEKDLNDKMVNEITIHVNKKIVKHITEITQEIKLK